MTRSVLLSFLGLLTFAATADATPIVVIAGQVVTINFDLTTATPAPPFAMLSIQTGTDFSTVSDPDIDEGLWELFAAPNATGSLLNASTDMGLMAFHDFTGNPDGVDG